MLPGSQQRALDQIERTLLDDDRQLGSLFATFTRLTSHEAMPWAERVPARPWPLRLRLRIAAAMAIGLAAVISALLLLAPASRRARPALRPPPRTCSPSAPARRLPARPGSQPGPARTGAHEKPRRP